MPFTNAKATLLWELLAMYWYGQTYDSPSGTENQLWFSATAQITITCCTYVTAAQVAEEQIGEHLVFLSATQFKYILKKGKYNQM